MNDKIQIDKDIPLPSEGRGRKSKYPFADMAVGDSFAVSNDDFASCRASITYAQRDGRKKFTLRRLPNENRCWRIS